MKKSENFMKERHDFIKERENLMKDRRQIMPLRHALHATSPLQDASSKNRRRFPNPRCTDHHASIFRRQTNTFGRKTFMFGRPAKIFGFRMNMFGRHKNIFCRRKNRFAWRKKIFGRRINMFGWRKNMFARQFNMFGRGPKKPKTAFPPSFHELSQSPFKKPLFYARFSNPRPAPRLL